MAQKCRNCGNEIFVPLNYKGNTYCHGCIREIAKECEKCGSSLERDDIVIHDKIPICRNCMQELENNQVKSNKNKSTPIKDMSNCSKGCIGCITIFAIILVIGIIGSSIEENSRSKDTNYQSRNNNIDDISIHGWAKQYVKSQLVSPSSAQFPKYYEAKIYSKGNNVYEVYTYVDSKNRMGVMTRLYYECTIEVSPSGSNATVTNFSWIQK